MNKKKKTLVHVLQSGADGLAVYACGARVDGELEPWRPGLPYVPRGPWEHLATCAACRVAAGLGP